MVKIVCRSGPELVIPSGVGGTGITVISEIS